MTVTVAVVIPAYNEAATIVEVVWRTQRQHPWVIVVDDGSTDGTRSLLAGLPVTVLSHSTNRGKAASLWSGIEYALQHGAQAVITLDADGQHQPEDIPKLVAASGRHPRAIIIAARTGKQIAAPRLRRFANALADFWLSWAAGAPIHDSQSGFRLYPGELLRRLNTTTTTPDPRQGFVFESEILIDAARYGFYPQSVAVAALYPPHARASYYRPYWDTWLIGRMVARKLLRRGLYPLGLLRALRLLPPAINDR